MLQNKIARIMTRDFKAISISMLKIKVYFIPQSLMLNKLLIWLLLQIAEIFLYNLFLNTKGNQNDRRITPLEIVIREYKICLGLSIN